MADAKASTDDEITIPEPLRPPPVDLSGGIEPLARAVIQSNQQEFLRAARGQRFAFATMKWLFLVVFLIALGAMIAAEDGAAVLAYIDTLSPRETARCMSRLSEKDQLHLLDLLSPGDAADVIELQTKTPTDAASARGAVGRRDAWFRRNAHEALVVWDEVTPGETARFVKALRDALGDEVWLVDPGPFT